MVCSYLSAGLVCSNSGEPLRIFSSVVQRFCCQVNLTDPKLVVQLNKLQTWCAGGLQTPCAHLLDCTTSRQNQNFAGALCTALQPTRWCLCAWYCSHPEQSKYPLYVRKSIPCGLFLLLCLATLRRMIVKPSSVQRCSRVPPLSP